MNNTLAEIDVWKIASAAAMGWAKNLSHDEREDLRQDICLKLLETREIWHGKQKPGAYAMRVARNMVNDWFRRGHRDREVTFTELGIDPLSEDYDETDEPEYIV